MAQHKPGALNASLRAAFKCQQAGRLLEAEKMCRQILTQDPEYLHALLLLAIVVRDLGDNDASVILFKKVIAKEPNSPTTHLHLGLAYNASNKLSEAIDMYERALHLDSNFSQAWNNLGMALQHTADPSGAMKALRNAVLHQSNDEHAHSNLLFVQSYNVLVSDITLLEESKRWDAVHGVQGRAKWSQCVRSGHASRNDVSNEADRRLRIGYVSPDLRHHAVNYFFEPILAEHNRSEVEIFCYAEVRRPDEATKRLQKITDYWRSTVGLSDEEVVRLIHDDQIDILVDLAGHTETNRLKVFTYKPAPVQVTYLGYCATTGLEAMDYWISDEVLHPDGAMELATETHYRLPRCWLCYRPHDNAPAVASVDPRRALTFGSLNDLSKITPNVISLWCEILSAVPQSRLLLKTRVLSDPVMQVRLKERFAANGISAERLILLPRTLDYLSAYHEIDIALDTFPRTGGATTADALWMGVPVITLSGERMIERQGVSMLTAVGLEEFIAISRQEYVAKAVALANDPQRRKQLRGSLREQMSASPLCDAHGLAQALESAYRHMWKKWLVDSR